MSEAKDAFARSGLLLPRTLEGPTLRLEPFEPAHAPALWEACDESCFRYWSDAPEPWTQAGMGAMVDRHGAHEGTLHYTVFDKATGACVGSSSFLSINLAQRTIEIGWTWIATSHRGTRVNPEMKLIMLEACFERDLFPETEISKRVGPGAGPALRMQLKTDARNAQSRAAILKLGAQFEGVLRNSVIMRDGHLRATAMYSIMPEEWPAVKAGLMDRLR